MTLLANLFLPLGLAVAVNPAALGLAVAFYVGKLFLLAVAVTLVEVTNAKLRFFRVPELMAVSLGLAMTVSPVTLGLAVAFYVGKLFLLAVAVTLVEVSNAKLRFFRVPELMAVSLGLGFLALAIRFL